MTLRLFGVAATSGALRVTRKEVRHAARSLEPLGQRENARPGTNASPEATEQGVLAEGLRPWNSRNCLRSCFAS